MIPTELKGKSFFTNPSFTSICVDKFLKDTKEDVWIIGGAKLFELYLFKAQELYITELEGDFKCTKFFPEFRKEFKIISKSDLKKENNIPFDSLLSLHL